MRSPRAPLVIRALILCCLALAAVPDPVSAQGAAARPVGQGLAEQRYLEIVTAYARGDEEQAAVRTLATWSERDVRKAVTGLLDRPVTIIAALPGEITPRTKAAAILLHTHVAMTLVIDAAESDVMPRAPLLHFAMAQSLLADVPPRREEPGHPPLPDLDPRFAQFTLRDWTLAVIRWLTWRHAFVPARQIARLSSLHGGGTPEELFRDDPEALLTIGIMEEAASIFEDREHDTRMGGSWDRGQYSKQARAAQERAERFYRLALDRQPSLAEARLRLARLLLSRSESGEASSNLRLLLEAATEPRIEYLGNLFLGRLHEQAGGLDEAIACYGKAVARYPACQTARLALTDAFARRGDMEQSAAVLAPLSARRQPVDPALDPWWAYPDGPYQQAVDYLDVMHRRGLGR